MAVVWCELGRSGSLLAVSLKCTFCVFVWFCGQYSKVEKCVSGSATYPANKAMLLISNCSRHVEPCRQCLRMLFSSSVKAGPRLPPVTAGIGVWLDRVGQAGTYGTTEEMNGRTRLYRCQEGIPISNGTRIEGVLVRIGSRRQDTK